MDFTILKKYQGDIIRFLDNSAKKNRIVHTYLFEGPKGTHKLLAAYYLANLILCEGKEKPCGECIHCKRIKENNFTNITLIDTQGESIKKEQVEALLHDFSMTSLEEGKRIFIIHGMDKATNASSNSLLKFLEESSETSYGILITENISKVLSTIQSRSQIISFKASPKILIVNELIRKGIDAEIARVVASITNNPEEGLQVVQDEKILDLIDVVKKIGSALILNGEHPIISVFAGETELLKERDKTYHHLFLDLLLTYLNDLLYFLLGQQDRMTFVDSLNQMKDEIKAKYNNVAYTKILHRMEVILKAKDRINYNVNLEALYFQMFIELVR